MSEAKTQDGTQDPSEPAGHGRVGCQHCCSSSLTAFLLQPRHSPSAWAQLSLIWLQCHTQNKHLSSSDLCPVSPAVEITQTHDNTVSVKQDAQQGLHKEKHIPWPGNHRTAIKQVRYGQCRKKGLPSLAPQQLGGDLTTSLFLPYDPQAQICH